MTMKGAKAMYSRVLRRPVKMQARQWMGIRLITKLYPPHEATMYQYASAVQALYASDPVLSVCGRRTMIVRFARVMESGVNGWLTCSHALPTGIDRNRYRHLQVCETCRCAKPAMLRGTNVTSMKPVSNVGSRRQLMSCCLHAA